MNPILEIIANPTEAEFWVLVALVIFFGLLIFLGVHKTAGKAIDGRVESIKSELEEAAKIRAEAQALLDSLKLKRVEAERQANEMMANAEAEALRFEQEARIKLEESLKRREELAERRIAQAEAQAAAEVRSAAIDAAAAMAEDVLKGRLKGKRSDPLIADAVAQMAGKLS
jgi:F-type H+-transporting ATPase subunit b